MNSEHLQEALTVLSRARLIAAASGYSSKEVHP